MSTLPRKDLCAHPRFSKSTVRQLDARGSATSSSLACATPTQGADKMGGASRKGREAQRDEFTTSLDNATRPLHGRSHDEMNVLRRQAAISSNAPGSTVIFQHSRPMQDAPRGEAKARADGDLYKASKQFFDLKC